MKTRFIINKLIPRTIDLIKVNMVLIMPFLAFLLLFVIVLSPIGAVNPFVMIAIIALKSVFVSGWLNMFHMCLENTKDESLSDDQKALDSINLYKEFFPGVGKYFQKIFWGILIFILCINIAEIAIFHFLGNFKSFSMETLAQSLNSKTDFIALWSKISHSDKIQIFKLVAADMAFITIFSYLTMFWPQSVIAEDKNPLNAFVSSIKAIKNDPLNTLSLFILILISFSLVFVVNFLLGTNILGQLISLMLFAYVIVYYTMMTFLYFERYR